LVAEMAANPRVQQAGLDIEANAAEHSAWIGQPKTSNPYTPETSATIRADSKQQRESSLWLKIKNFFGGAVMDAIMGILGTVFPQYSWIPALLWGGFETWRRWRADKKVMAGYKGVSDIMKSVKGGKGLSVGGIKDILRNAQTAYNVWPIVKKDLDKLWKLSKVTKIKSDTKDKT